MSLSARARPTEPPEKAGGAPYRVAIVEESAVVRGMMSRWLSEEGVFDVVARFGGAEMAISKISQLNAEVLVVDLDGEKFDGAALVEELHRLAPSVKIGVISKAAGDTGCELRDFQGHGVTHILRRPITTRDVTNSKKFHENFAGLVKELGEGLRRERGEALPDQIRQSSETGERAALRGAPARRGAPGSAQAARGPATRGRVARPSQTRGRPGVRRQPEQDNRAGKGKDGYARTKPSKVPATILAVGSSTGGPKALYSVFEALRGKINVPVVITQHMPPMFTAILAEHLTKASGLVAKEAEDGEELKSGVIYVAPGDYHMEVKGTMTTPRIELNQGPEENFCRPSVDPMLRSVKALYGPRALCVILTGMGQDGCEGARDIIEGGGTVLAQDEATSVVWGMPGAVAKEGLAAEILPLSKIGPTIERFLKGGNK